MGDLQLAEALSRSKSLISFVHLNNKNIHWWNLISEPLDSHARRITLTRASWIAGYVSWVCPKAVFENPTQSVLAKSQRLGFTCNEEDNPETLLDKVQYSLYHYTNQLISMGESFLWLRRRTDRMSFHKIYRNFNLCQREMRLWMINKDSFWECDWSIVKPLLKSLTVSTCTEESISWIHSSGIKQQYQGWKLIERVLRQSLLIKLQFKQGSLCLRLHLALKQWQMY